jgi:transposase/helix-turn-helix protein
MADEGLPVEVACRVLDVSCSGFYAWRFRPPSVRAVRHAWLTDVIREVHAASYGTYGAKRVYAELMLGRGIQVGHSCQALSWRKEMLRSWQPRESTPMSCVSARSGSCSESGRPIAHVARDLGVHKEALRHWVRRAEADSGRRPDLLRPTSALS